MYVQSIPPRTDLREMLREYIMCRGLACMDAASHRREAAISAEGDFEDYRRVIRESVREFYGSLPVGKAAPPIRPRQVSAFDFRGFRVENVLFESFPGWEVNATVYVPADFSPPFPAVIVPVGHSGKQFESYQLPCQYFARAGFLAVCFDPPGQAGEKQPGNDHFIDGVREYLVGRSSSRYFIADALRCLDYLETRGDVDLSAGAAMTGVSGGGTTTTFAALLDGRISVIGPSCCISPLAELDISQCYGGCPETHQWRRYAEGVDEADLFCAAAPTPCLLMAGEADEVFNIAEVRRVAEIAERAYAKRGAAGKFRLFIDASGHAYTLAQAAEFARFMSKWLRNDPAPQLPDINDADFKLLPYEKLQCRPRQDVNMRALAFAEADRLAASRSVSFGAVRQAASGIAQTKGKTPAPEAEVSGPFQVWYHDWRSVMLRPEPGIELPATFITARDRLSAPAVLHFDDAGRHRLLQRGGPLAGAMGFLNDSRRRFNLLTVDLRGWGDTYPAMRPYDIPGWAGIDRCVAYDTAALGDPVMSMRIRDGLASLAWLRSRPETDPAAIVLTGAGLGGLVALHVAAIDGDVAGVAVWDGLSSWRSLAAAERYPWPADAFVPNVLKYYDIPQLASAIPAPVHVHNLRDGAGGPADEQELKAWRGAPNVIVSTSAEAFDLATCVEAMAGSGSAFRSLRRKEPFLWMNPGRRPSAEALCSLPFSASDIAAAEARWRRCAPLLEKLFPELRSSRGVIESPLLPAPRLAERILPSGSGRLFVKADHALPVAGSIKARGGIYTVLHFAEKIALERGVLSGEQDDYLKLAGAEARALFGQYTLSVGSTGNLGLSIGIMGAALGFNVEVHMSAEAKDWKKERLRRLGVKVIEHASDYTAACAVARAEAAKNPRIHFIDDENSVELFLGYACAVPVLKRQLAELGVTVDAAHPLFLYLPCGVGGGPGGITFAARHVFGDHAHCFFVEPIEAPCMLLGMLTGRHSDISVYSVGLTLKTDADGLAVSAPSRFIGKLMAPLLDGCFTARDETFYRHLLDMHESEGMEVEPSAAAGCAGPRMLLETETGRDYLRRRGLSECMPQSSHIVWTTGGLFVPPEVHEHFRRIAREIL